MPDTPSEIDRLTAELASLREILMVDDDETLVEVAHEVMESRNNSALWGQEQFQRAEAVTAELAEAKRVIRWAEIAAGALDRYRFYIDASQQELDDLGMSRETALARARSLDPYNGTTPSAAIFTDFLSASQSPPAPEGVRAEVVSYPKPDTTPEEIDALHIAAIDHLNAGGKL